MNLQVEAIRSECDKARREVEASDADISGMEQEEERLKLTYVESAPESLKRMCSSAIGRATATGRATPVASSLSPPHGVPNLGHNTGQLTWPSGKLNYEKLHASKYSKQQELKIARQGKTRTAKDSCKLKGAIDTKQLEWTKAHERHVSAEQTANALAERLEAIEKDKDAQLRRLQAQKQEVERFAHIYEGLKLELETVQASVAAA